jgi:glycerol-3-phosphate O-acyltransferase
VWTDDNGKLDYDAALEGMVRDARVILAREMRHSILKITGNDTEAQRAAPEPEATATPAEETPNTSEELHQRHVIAEHHEHEHEHVDQGKD